MALGAYNSSSNGYETDMSLAETPFEILRLILGDKIRVVDPVAVGEIPALFRG